MRKKYPAEISLPDLINPEPIDQRSGYFEWDFTAPELRFGALLPAQIEQINKLSLSGG